MGWVVMRCACEVGSHEVVRWVHEVSIWGG